MRYMLDTNTCIHIIKYRSGTLYDRLSSLPVEDAGVSSIVAAELWVRRGSVPKEETE
jgi:predicted nucleic acid-binding protein